MGDTTLAVVLAAGQGKRMRSDLPKVLHPLGGRPLLHHVLELAVRATDQPPIVILAPDAGPVAELVAGLGARSATQQQPRGTGDALRSVPAAQRHDGTVLVLSGDVPLLRPHTLARLLEQHHSTGAALTMLTAVPDDPRGLGRVARGAAGRVEAVVEERDLDPSRPAPAECAAGVYVFAAAQLWPALERVTDANAQGEYYLTELVGLLTGDGQLVETVVLEDATEAMGINDRVQLAQAEVVLRSRTLESLMRGGVTIEDPMSTFVDSTVVVGQDTVLLPLTVLRGSTELGRGCRVGPGAHLRDVTAGDAVTIGQSTLEECVLGNDVVIGPYNRVRPGSHLEAGVHLGTHAEVKNSRVGQGTRIGHFSCVLDADVGVGVNVSAGVITCNYDGWTKSRTAIGDRAFIGSDAMLVAPIRIGADAYVAAGSTISEDVPDGALAVERAYRRTIAGWVERRRQRHAAAGSER